jgi:two-component system chemotaxis response regulator CheB
VVTALRLHGDVLAVSALSAGLGALRPRSAPPRVVREAQAFMRLCAAACADPAGVDAAVVRAEVRTGCFACASGPQLAALLKLWRGALSAFLAGIPRGAALAAEVVNAIGSAAERERAQWENRRIDVVTVGASAGGLEPLAELVSRLGPEVPASVICIFHVSPRGPSVLPAILARRARVPVAAASDGAVPYLGHVYVAPPGHHLVVDGGRLRLADGPPVHFVKPSADVLFESAALAWGGHVASVVLSGSGSDGAAGTRAIHEHGGLTLVQDPREAEFSSMPEAAIATGYVERMLPVAEIVRTLRSAILQGRSAA